MLPHQQGPKLSMVLVAPVHPRHQGADSGELPHMSETGTIFLCRFIPLSDLVFLTENFAVGPKKIQEAECLVHETMHDGTVGQKIEQVPGVTNSGELAPAPAKAPVLPCFSKGDGTARCLTNSLHQVPHLGTPG
ncbi:hypothetical protein ES288_D07G284700v1 [Gossypium darwinii]|uniref:Uncharacterized protein n=1 Tax=Gossypium darwinii TaxID=34276 RepID=A0A5D2C4N7_GOSDA|nr:hypothetical protein ES288_D07G284700v1 [Gossypium darwinii]